MRIRLLVAILLCGIASSAQQTTLYKYQDLSHVYYNRLKDSLKKAWVCPNVYPAKETQKKYAEIWNGRTDFLVNAINDDSYVNDGEVFDYVKGILNQIQGANKDRIKSAPLLLLDRSSAVNAYAIGGNIVVVNLGFISFATTREELAFAIAHELSHNILMHPETGMSKRAEWLTSDEYKKSLDAVLDSKYERLSRLKKVIETYSFSRNRHQRYHESDADSLAVVLLKKSNISFTSDFFLRLDSSDQQYKKDLKNSVVDYFNGYGLTLSNSWTQKRSRGLSTKAFNIQDSSHVDDSLKTHPGCPERYITTKKYNDNNIIATSLPTSIREKANKMLIWNQFNNMSLTPCLYRILQEKDKGNSDPWYDFMVHNVMMGLYYSDSKLMRFNAIGVVPKEYTSKKYYELQTMLEQIPRESLEQSCHTIEKAAFWGNIKTAELALKSFMNSLVFTAPSTEKERVKIVGEFIASNPTSMYNDFVNNFKTK